MDPIDESAQTRPRSQRRLLVGIPVIFFVVAFVLLNIPWPWPYNYTPLDSDYSVYIVHGWPFGYWMVSRPWVTPADQKLFLGALVADLLVGVTSAFVIARLLLFAIERSPLKLNLQFASRRSWLALLFVATPLLCLNY